MADSGFVDSAFRLSALLGDYGLTVIPVAKGTKFLVSEEHSTAYATGLESSISTQIIDCSNA